MTDTKRLWHRRLHDFEVFDRIEMDVVPRYKTSGLSGDEWRQHVRIRFYFKGEVIHEDGARDMDSALLTVGRIYLEQSSPIPKRIIELEKKKCDQPSCTADAIGRFRLKRYTSERGEYLHDSENQHSDHFRQFCRQHIRRGDCSREDSDENYEPLDSVGPDDSSNVIESPAVFGGVMTMEADGE